MYGLRVDSPQCEPGKTCSRFLRPTAVDMLSIKNNGGRLRLNAWRASCNRNGEQSRRPAEWEGYGTCTSVGGERHAHTASSPSQPTVWQKRYKQTNSQFVDMENHCAKQHHEICVRCQRRVPIQRTMPTADGDSSSAMGTRLPGNIPPRIHFSSHTDSTRCGSIMRNLHPMAQPRPQKFRVKSGTYRGACALTGAPPELPSPSVLK